MFTSIWSFCVGIFALLFVAFTSCCNASLRLLTRNGESVSHTFITALACMLVPNHWVDLTEMVSSNNDDSQPNLPNVMSTPAEIKVQFIIVNIYRFLRMEALNGLEISRCFETLPTTTSRFRQRSGPVLVETVNCLRITNSRSDGTPPKILSL